MCGVVINRKTTKFESNSQQVCPYEIFIVCCYQSQNYKIWKQFTTLWNLNNYETSLLSIAKLQNLKAIHNLPCYYQKNKEVVINRKTTKFESNSQQLFSQFKKFCSCYQSQNYKIWKQFTTFYKVKPLMYWLLSIAKLQNLKAIHNSESA